MSLIRRIFGLSPVAQKQRAPYTYSQNKDGTQRVQMYEDTTVHATAAKFNHEMIYGDTAQSPMFGMKPVIEVRGADGNWTPVNGSRDGVPAMDAQIQMLQNYNDTGKLGYQPAEVDSGTGTGTDVGASAQGAKAETKSTTSSSGDRSGPNSNPNTSPAMAAPVAPQPLALPWMHQTNQSVKAMTPALDKLIEQTPVKAVKKQTPHNANAETPAGLTSNVSAKAQVGNDLIDTVSAKGQVNMPRQSVLEPQRESKIGTRSRVF